MDKKKPIKFKVVKPKPKPTPKMEEKKKKIKFVVKKKEEPAPAPKKKPIKFKVVKKKEEPKPKPKPISELQRVAGLSKEEANKMNPAELFGKLPVELRKKILDPKETGVQVGRERVGFLKFMDEFKDLRDEKDVLQDSHLRDPNIPDSFVTKVTDLFIKINKFLSNFRGVMLEANNIKTSQKNTRQLMEQAKRTKKWNRIIDYLGKSAKQIWNENTGEFMLEIKKLKTEKLKY